MVNVMSGDLSRQVGDGHWSTLGMDTAKLPLLWRELVKHAQVRRPSQAKQLQRFLRIRDEYSPSLYQRS